MKEFLTDFILTLDQPKERAKESLKRAIKFAQTAEFPPDTYFDMKPQLIDEAIRDGHAAGTVDPRLSTEPGKHFRATVDLLRGFHGVLLCPLHENRFEVDRRQHGSRERGLVL